VPGADIAGLGGDVVVVHLLGIEGRKWRVQHKQKSCEEVALAALP
jgi:hypothetical protein